MVAQPAARRTRPVLDIDASLKGARFIRTCDAFNIPHGDLRGRARVPAQAPSRSTAASSSHGAKLLYAYCEATVPKLTVITRKAYGGAYDVMSSKHIRGDLNLAWPSAEIAVMGPEGAVNILYRRQLAEADDPEALRKQLVDEYVEKFGSPYVAAEKGYLDAVIRPRETRRKLIRGLHHFRSKRDSNPPKKHGCIPL